MRTFLYLLAAALVLHEPKQAIISNLALQIIPLGVEHLGLPEMFAGLRLQIQAFEPWNARW
jgi:hypothetical protein